MKVLNVMFGKGLGGIEQAFLDYSEAMHMAGLEVFALIQPDAKIEESSLYQFANQVIKIRNMCKWDFLAMKKIKKTLASIKPDVIVTHGNRAFTLMKKASGNKHPVVALAHNYSVKNFRRADAVIAITEAIKMEVIKAGAKPDNVFKIPNMIKIPQSRSRTKVSDYPVIGVMGRFVKKKGFDTFIKALKEVAAAGHDFRAYIAGEGEERDDLIDLCRDLEIDKKVHFIGWVNDKKNFFSSLDIFCVPSLHEPFGIVILEAFAYNVPVITTDSEGPNEIAKHEKDALFVTKGSSKELSEALIRLLNDAALAESLKKNALNSVQTRYDMSIISGVIKSALIDVKEKHNSNGTRKAS